MKGSQKHSTPHVKSVEVYVCKSTIIDFSLSFFYINEVTNLQLICIIIIFKIEPASGFFSPQIVFEIEIELDTVEM